MINLLRIISLAAAVLAIIFFVFPIVYGINSEQQVKDFLKNPEIRMQFENATESRLNKNKDLTSPLVKQARTFASYLNPKPTAKRSPTASRAAKITNSLSVSPKFKLHCTSYYAEDPNLSRALIDEPGKGRHWVRPSSKVGHLLVEQIKDGLIVVKGGKESYEVAIEESTVKSISSPSQRTSTQNRFSPKSPVSSEETTTVSEPSTTVSLQQEPDEDERDARARALIEKLRDLQKDTVSDKNAGIDDKDKAARIERLISQYQSTRISPEEAKKLGKLGETLEDEKNSDPNRTPSNTGKSR